MNNDTLDNLATNLKKIENSKLMNTDLQNINSVDIDTLKKENEFLKSKLNIINNGNRNFNQKKKLNNNIYVDNPYRSLKNNPNDTFNNKMCNYNPYNNSNKFHNQNYYANNSLIPNNYFNSQNYHLNNNFSANNRIMLNQYVNNNNYFNRKNSHNPRNNFNNNNGYTETK